MSGDETFLAAANQKSGRNASGSKVRANVANPLGFFLISASLELLARLRM